jgi:hypothetical protein
MPGHELPLKGVDRDSARSELIAARSASCIALSAPASNM